MSDHTQPATRGQFQNLQGVIEYRLDRLEAALVDMAETNRALAAQAGVIALQSHRIEVLEKQACALTDKLASQSQQIVDLKTTLVKYGVYFWVIGLVATQVAQLFLK